MQENRNSEITLKELILTIQEYAYEIWKHKVLVVLLAIPFVAYMLYQAITTAPVYSAGLTFMVNENEGGGIGGVGAILGQFGLGGGAGGGKHNLDKILELARSRKIIQQVLFEKKELDGKEDFMANHLINIYDFHAEWEKGDNEEIKGFVFKHSNVDIFKPLENGVLKNLYRFILGGKDRKGLLTTGYSKTTGIMNITASVETELCAITLAEVVYDKLSSYYIEKTIEKQKRTYDVVEAKVDSIKRIMEGKEYELANFKDSSRGLVTKKARLKEVQLSRDAKVLGLLYGEALKNLEIADFSLRTKTPFVQQIDSPIAPIEPIRKSKVMALLIGGLLGGFIGVTFILGRKIIKDALKVEG